MKRLFTFLIMAVVTCLLKAQVSTENYIRTRRMTNESGTSYTAQIDYYDALGRPFQQIWTAVQNGSAVSQNRAALQEYDLFGRITKSWLTTSAGNEVYLPPASFKDTAISLWNNDSLPYTQNIYDASPLNRLTLQYGAGTAWYNGGHGNRITYMMNIATAGNELACKRYTINGTSLSGGSTNYPAGTLQVVKATDEDGHISYTFTDRLGRTVLIRQMNGTTQYDTYYVYDSRNNLCFVLQPEYQFTNNLSKHAFQYKYDGYGRCSEKTVPGVGTERYDYDAADRLIFSQNGNQNVKNHWTYYEYDSLNRLTEQGECNGKDTNSKNVWRKNYYDNYNFRSQTGFNNSNFPAGTVNARGFLTGSEATVLGSSTKLYSAYYYDIKGRMTKTVRNNLLGGYDVTTTTYTFTDRPQTVTHTHTASGKTSITEVYTYTYDHADRLTKVQHKIGNTQITLLDCTYDDLGRLKTRTPHGIASAKLTYDYNLRGWLTAISGTKFSQNLYYNTGNGTPCYNGNISSMTWKAGNETTLRGYKFTYDGLDRMLDAVYGESTSISSNANRFTEKVTGYDKNGNILALQRYGQTGTSTYGLIDNLTFTLNGNQLNRVDDAVTASAYNNGFEFKDAVKQADEYAYDANGNLTKDLNKGISNISYNCLNLPSVVTFSDGSTITYTYAADGTKLRTVHTIGSTTTTTDYCGNVIYENGVQKLLLTEAGYVTLADSKYHYYLQDHQGNNRVVIDQNGTVEETNHYYPFGGVFANSTSVQPYKYNGKELDTKKGLNWYDYGARHRKVCDGGSLIGIVLRDFAVCVLLQ